MFAPIAVPTPYASPHSPLPAAAQTDFVPPAATAAISGGPLISHGTAAAPGSSSSRPCSGTRKSGRRPGRSAARTTNSLAELGNAFGDWRLIVPAFSAGYLAGEIGGDDRIKGMALRAGAAVALASGITGGLKYAVGRIRPS